MRKLSVKLCPPTTLPSEVQAMTPMSLDHFSFSHCFSSFLSPLALFPSMSHCLTSSQSPGVHIKIIILGSKPIRPESLVVRTKKSAFYLFLFIFYDAGKLIQLP